jgi:hypothetical protein
MTKRAVTILAGSTLLLFSAATRAENWNKVDHEATLKECSACHMVYQPQMLPARSWQAIMTGLDDHFGENASLDQAVADDITAYLTANAADAPGSKSRWLRGLKDTDTPLRISDTPRFRRAHGEVSEAVYKRKDIGSKSNCAACHQGAEAGHYNEPGE